MYHRPLCPMKRSGLYMLRENWMLRYNDTQYAIWMVCLTIICFFSLPSFLNKAMQCNSMQCNLMQCNLMLCNAMQFIAMQKVFNTLFSNIQWVVLSFYCDLDRLSWQCGARLIEKIKKWRIVTKKAPIGAKKKKGRGRVVLNFASRGRFETVPLHMKMSPSHDPWIYTAAGSKLELTFPSFQVLNFWGSTFCGWQCSKVDGINFRYIGG